MERACTSPRRILVVDDEPQMREALKLALSADGHQVITAGSGPEALDHLSQNDFDLVITDYSMPHMKGDKLATEIKREKPDLPVVMITAYMETLTGNKTPLPGVDALVSKPFRLLHLRETIAGMLARG
jgi:CheY-like chemotaxis protein